jgi:hypothetical protein
MKNIVERQVDMEEVQTARFDIGAYKAPGPDVMVSSIREKIRVRGRIISHRRGEFHTSRAVSQSGESLTSPKARIQSELRVRGFTEWYSHTLLFISRKWFELHY